MAYSTAVKGHNSEAIVEITLLAMGWEVSRPIVDEKYDLLVRMPGAGPNEFLRLQVKTIRRRADRKNEMVIYSTYGQGNPYTYEHCDYIVGVNETTFYMIPCDGRQEYWASDEKAEREWEKFQLQVAPNAL